MAAAAASACAPKHPLPPANNRFSLAAATRGVVACCYCVLVLVAGVCGDAASGCWLLTKGPERAGWWW